MCGICGKLNFDGQPVDRELVHRMCQAIVHRGPDSEGIYWNGNIGMGNRRLSIIDLSTGDQPITNEDKTVWIVYNGETYNYPHLRAELEARGHQFYTNADTEAIVHLYEEMGPACVTKLRGMFAFALWDIPRQRLFLARDRVGKKPLYYRLTDHDLTFGSEIKTILADPSVPREMDLHAFHDYLTYQYVPSPCTIFQGIQKLPPGYTLIWENGQATTERYWQLDFTRKNALSEAETVERLREIFEEAVRIRLLSDVPLGAFLSGGIDSSLVVAFMSRLMDQPTKTFSIGFEEQAFNELPYARIVADHFATEHHEFVVKPDAIAVLPDLIWHFDEPFADASALPTYYVSQITGHFVKVALNGDGGDESFVGYERYMANYLVQLYRFLPEPLRECVISKIANTLAVNGLPGSFGRRLRWLNELSLESPEELYAHSMCILSNEVKHQLYTPAVLAHLADQNSLEWTMRSFSNGHANNLIERMLYSDIMTYLPDDLLVKVDRMAMAHSLEGRSPFLDHELMEFTASIPGHLKFKPFRLKYLLKKMGAGILPAPILKRKKMGFGVPLGPWFRGELRPLFDELVNTSRLVTDGYFNQKELLRLADEHYTGRNDHGHRLWSLMIIELWYRRFIRNESIHAIAEHPATGY